MTFRAIRKQSTVREQAFMPAPPLIEYGKENSPMDNRYVDASVLKAELDGYVMGQEEGIRRVAMAVSSHLIRMRAHARNASSRIRKDNMLLVGPSGCGKTETFRVLQRLEEELRIPIIMRAAMSYSPNRSWKGIPLENILRDLYDADSLTFFLDA